MNRSSAQGVAIQQFNVGPKLENSRYAALLYLDGAHWSSNVADKVYL